MIMPSQPNVSCRFLYRHVSKLCLRIQNAKKLGNVWDTIKQNSINEIGKKMNAKYRVISTQCDN
jgi:hypothetical protein